MMICLTRPAPPMVTTQVAGPSTRGTALLHLTDRPVLLLRPVTA
ncbi:MAG TPA: hypothetical protein VFH51_04765 [Myxococcota bacterium]|nr:hypothetical protein [Myxococcota bacterium]